MLCLRLPELVCVKTKSIIPDDSSTRIAMHSIYQFKNFEVAKLNYNYSKMLP